MQAWELERELGRAQDKIEAIETWRAKWFRKSLVVGPFLKPIRELDKILEDQSSGETPT